MSMLQLKQVSDENCSVEWDGWGGREGVWFPGAGISEEFKERVGSYTCVNGTTTCPPAGTSSATSIASTSRLTYPTMSTLVQVVLIAM